MKLSELTAYAEKKFHIREEFRWADHPGFSVLADPDTGEWAALLMRIWDPETYDTAELCDMKCGRQTLLEIPFSYLSAPFRMHGQKWIGIRLADVIDPAPVLRLFDRAVHSGEQKGYTIVLDQPPAEKQVWDRFSPREETVYGETALPARWPGYIKAEDVLPERIRKMKKLYEYGSGSFHQKCRNFFQQGMYMQDYEDDHMWEGDLRLYFPTYHDLNNRQLRGYFSWRTRLRKGEYIKGAACFAYIYLYELLNGIGTSSAEESLQKMKEFEEKYLDAGHGDPEICHYIRRWMRDLAIIKMISPDQMLSFEYPDVIKKDKSLSVLRDPDERTDDEIYEAAVIYAGKHLSSSPAAAAGKGKSLIAGVWRKASRAYKENGKDLFRACFGEEKEFSWHPLANAVYWEQNALENREYILNDCRSYVRRDGTWMEKRYEKLFFNMEVFRGLFHAADAGIRKYLKTGHYLRGKTEENWAVPFVEAVIEEDRQAEIEAARPKITIDLTGLDQIRKDAEVTRDSLLTEEELGESDAYQAGNDEKQADLEKEADLSRKEDRLDDIHLQILNALLDGHSAEGMIKEHHLMSSLVADTINEALYEEFGDSVIECDGDRLALVEDYVEDLAEFTGRNPR